MTQTKHKDARWSTRHDLLLWGAIGLAIIGLYAVVSWSAPYGPPLWSFWAIALALIGMGGVGRRLIRREYDGLAALESSFRLLRTDLQGLGELGTPRVHQSIHHLFEDRDVLRPRGGGNVDMVLDAADLPSTLTDYLKDVYSAGAKARILLLDPDSTLTERHRFVQQAGGDESSAVQHFRAKINSAIAELGPLAAVRIFDAVPPGNLIIVDDQIFWGGVPSVPSDASYPIIGITADTREHVYWAFRRNFDVLWKQAKPVDAIAPRTTRSIAAASL